MALAATGLNTHIWNNNIRSILLLAIYPFIIGIMVWAVAYIIGYSQAGQEQAANYYATNIIEAYWPTILTIVAVWFIVAYFFNTRMIGMLAHAHPVTRQQEPELYNLLENLCIARGMKMPNLSIIETHACNAFASGVDNKSYRVTVTRGLMNRLRKDELEGVLAHELTHIINRDVRLMMVCVIFTGMIGFAAQLAWSSIRHGMIYSRRSRNNGGGVMIMLGIALVLWVGYMATLFTRFALSRRREFMADAGAVELTKNPDAMMRALMRIADRDHIPGAPDDIAMMCIENAKPFMGLFATHPPIESRIRALSEVTGTPVPEFREFSPPAPPDERFGTLPSGRANPWLSAERRKKNPWAV